MHTGYQFSRGVHMYPGRLSAIHFPTHRPRSKQSNQQPPFTSLHPFSLFLPRSTHPTSCHTHGTQRRPTAHAADATDEEQSSDDEAPEEVSTAAATALAGRRRKAELQARQASATPKRKRARTSPSSSAKGAGGSAASEGGEAEDGGAGAGDGDDDGLELPSDLLLRVKSGGLQRMEADVLEAKEMEEQAAAAAAAALGGRRGRRVKAGDVPRR